MVNNKSFFNNIDKVIYNNPEKLAVAYLEFLIKKYSHNPIRNNRGSIAITCNDISLNNITKRCLLISDQLYISGNSNNTNKIFVDSSTLEEGYTSSYYTNNDNLYELGLWIQKTRALLINETVSYIPTGIRIANGVYVGKSISESL